MAVELTVPSVGESIAEVQIGEWTKRVGDRVQPDDTVVVLETDKAAMEVPAPVAGVLARILRQSGEMARPGDVIGLVAETAEEAQSVAAQPAAPAAQPELPKPPVPEMPAAPDGARTLAQEAPAQPVLPKPPVQEAPVTTAQAPAAPRGEQAVREEVVVGTAAARAAELPAEEKHGTAAPVPSPERAPTPTPPPPAPMAVAQPQKKAPTSGGREEEVVPMSALRRRIAERLVQAQQTAALLTTFNEVDMSAIVALRRELQDTFQARHNIKLGLMSFFVKAAVEALKMVPQINAETRDNSIVYRNYYDIGIAIGGGRGLVVPVLRNAERLSFAEIERAIDDFARRARENKLTLEELQGGTFTISNGGVYGSMLSTPIVNPPQSGVLGMHAIQDRPVARDGQVVIRPMMYLALTYDHRIVDGREAVTFLRRVKECIEEPTRLLLEV